MLAMIFGRQKGEENKENTKLITRYAITEARRKSVRILLVEDNPVNSMLALRLLQKFGYQAYAVFNGKEALKALEISNYDLILMDVQMPEMDGLEATAAIRNPKSKVMNPNIPIVAMTAHAMKGDRELCLNAGMDDYVSKPIKPDLLFAAIEKQIEKKAGSDEIINFKV
jgi:CheY-like chemotaxis protein